MAGWIQSGDLALANDTRERLVSTSSDLFYQHGFQAVGLDQILDTVGITKTAFYKHFESKDELIVAALEHRDRKDMGEWFVFFEARQDEDAKSRLLAVFDLLDDWFGKPDFRGCLFMSAATEFPSRNDPIHRAAALHMDKVNKELQRMAAAAGASDPDSLARQILLLMTGAITTRHAAGDPNAAATAKETAALLVERYCRSSRVRSAAKA